MLKNSDFLIKKYEAIICRIRLCNPNRTINHFLNENVWILNKISLNFVPKCLINNISALIQIMAWCQPGDCPFSEPMMFRFLTQICVTRPRWVKAPENPPQPFAYYIFITVMSNEHQDISIHLPLNCLFSSWFRLISRGTSRLHITGPL